MSKRNRPANLFAIFVTVFVDMLAFGMVIPDIQLRGRSLGLDGVQLGILLGVYSLAQLFTAPVLGRLSDRIGRRKVLLLTTALSTIAFLLYAHADQYWAIFASRILAGIAGGNLGVAYAYVADVTKPSERTKGMGMIGAAFGLGFILGPVMGAQLIIAGNDRPLILGYVTAFLALLNFSYVAWMLPEPERHGRSIQGSFFGNIERAFTTPNLGLLLAMFFAANLGFVNLETTFFQLLHHPNWIFWPAIHGDSELAKKYGSYLLGYAGLVMAIMQGMIARRLSGRFGELPVLRFSYWLQIPCLILVAFSPLWLPLLLVLLGLGIANGLLQPNLSSLVSKNAPADMQGSIFGVTQSLGACARMLGPMIGNTLFDVQPYLPYLIGAAIILFPALAAWKVKPLAADEGVAEAALAH